MIRFKKQVLLSSKEKKLLKNIWTTQLFWFFEIVNNLFFTFFRVSIELGFIPK